MLRILKECWPALLPLLLFLLWHWRSVRRAEKAALKPPRWRDGPWLWAVLAAAAIVVLILVLTGLTAPALKGNYIPPHLENGKMVEGRITHE